jgi:hypothetical protein
MKKLIKSYYNLACKRKNIIRNNPYIGNFCVIYNAMCTLKQHPQVKKFISNDKYEYGLFVDTIHIEKNKFDRFFIVGDVKRRLITRKRSAYKKKFKFKVPLKDFLNQNYIQSLLDQTIAIRDSLKGLEYQHTFGEVRPLNLTDLEVIQIYYMEQKLSEMKSEILKRVSLRHVDILGDNKILTDDLMYIYDKENEIEFRVIYKSNGKHAEFLRFKFYEEGEENNEYN